MQKGAEQKQPMEKQKTEGKRVVEKTGRDVRTGPISGS